MNETKYDGQVTVAAIYDDDSGNPLLEAMPPMLSKDDVFERLKSVPECVEQGSHDQGVIIYIDDKKDPMSSLWIFGDKRGQIHPGTAGEHGSTITDFSMVSGIAGKRYGLVDADGVRWDVLIFGEDEDYAIWIRLDNAFYLEYEPTINAIIDSFTFIE